MDANNTREVVIDLCGAILTQEVTERIVNEANAPGDEQLVTITIKNIDRHRVPRLIVDYGDLIHRIVAEMDRDPMAGVYGVVTIETKGVKARKEDALECLLALCRVIGLKYEISKNGTPEYPYLVRVTWSDWPTDFFEPRSRRGGFSTCCKDPVDGLTSGIFSAVTALELNGASFRSGFLDYWKQVTGRDWLAGRRDETS